ncbi:hypothetical protein NDU88_009020 [Pleurodeles waltl]|uniref:Uncharacterized protein n=1 Tax=Pleurodeles waltl TaxID=8319 RepID=A0AAV7PYC0_PLEWA|nr:hypothetical protein NDU88_009020 [Pleurodeles waltl]
MQTVETAPSPTLGILNLILEGNKAIMVKIDWVDITVALLHQDMEKMREQLKDLGTRADHVVLGAHNSKLAEQERQLKHQEAKLADLEDITQE